MAVTVSFLSFVLTILYQPIGQNYFVYAIPGTVTNFNKAQNGNIGLLAHEEYTGQAFAQLQKYDIVTLQFKNRHSHSYQVSEILRYIATNPYSIASTFINVDTGEVIASIDLGNGLYVYGDRQLILQTCFDETRGRLFIVALPIQDAQFRTVNIHRNSTYRME
jgi:hypothetical protein